MATIISRRGYFWVACAVVCTLTGGAIAPAKRAADPGIERAIENVRARTYWFHPDGEAAVRAVNRAHGIGARVTPVGVDFEVSQPGSSKAQLSLRLRALERGNEKRNLAPGTAVSDEARAEIRREDAPLVEWYRNDDRGVEQGIDLARDPLPGEGVLRLVLETGGTLSPRVDDDGRGVALHDETGALQMRFGSLVAFDAKQNSLPARMLVADGRLVYEVDDHDATYPIVVDPLASSANFTSAFPLPSGGEEAADQRFAVSTAGDVNGDGYSDLLVGVWYAQRVQGSGAFLFLGSANGLSASPDWQTVASEYNLGVSVSTAGDVNGDGFDDILVGAYDADDQSQIGEGAAYLWLGSADMASRPDGTRANADWSAESNQANAGWTPEIPEVQGFEVPVFGTSVSTGGNLNGDAYADIVIGFPGYDGVANSAGQRDGVVLVWLGSAQFQNRPDGTPANADWRADPAGTTVAPTAMFGTIISIAFGASVADAGDVNGDGFDDLIVGAPFAGQLGAVSGSGGALVWLGSAGFASDPDGTFDNADWKYAAAPSLGSYSGTTVAGAGDVDGDGYADVILTTRIGAGVVYDPSGYQNDVGLFRGNATTFLGSSPVFNLVTFRPFISSSPYFAWLPSVGTAGDVNGDGLADIVIGLPQRSDLAGAHEGEARVYVGRRGDTPNPVPYATRTGGGSQHQLGIAVATAGDVNGDGFSDVVASGNWYDQARVYHGGGDTITQVADFTFTGALPASDAGGAPGVGLGLGFAGDINGDGFGDFVVGMPGIDPDERVDAGAFQVTYGGPCGTGCPPGGTDGTILYYAGQEGERLGSSVVGAGDVNGDGYSDVIVGAPNYDGVAGSDVGRAFVWYGALQGLGTVAPTELTGKAAANENFGASVASAGDVNGDGRSDVIVGAPNADSGGFTDNGTVYVYLGTPSGISTTWAWTRSGAKSYAHFGISVASAGDVNRDGKSDVIIGADGDGPASWGAAYVYEGLAGGLAASPVWSAYGQGVFYGSYGASVASAGDVNGDGYSDVIVGDASYDESATLSGHAYIYHGSGAGPSLSPSTTLSGTNYVNSRYGSSVSTAGDVNGDGFSDVIVGEQWHTGAAGDYQGRALVFHGSASGVVTAAARIVEDCGDSPCDYGRDVAGGGDVNGDGFADVLIGAFRRTVGGVPDQGGVFVHFGNLGTGDARLPTQRDMFGVLISLLGSTRGFFNFSAETLGRSPAGRTHVWLETEGKPLFTLLDGTGIVSSGVYDTTTSGVSLYNYLSCALNQPCHWRARLRNKNPYFPRSRWYSPPGNGRQETDLLGAIAPDADGDGIADTLDNCPTVSNADQADGGVGPTQFEAPADGVGNVCDNCVNVNNPRVVSTFLTTNPWATLTGGQRDDDHDGYGNKCDGDFTAGGTLTGTPDLTQWRTANGKARSSLTLCGSPAGQRCARYDMDESGALIGTPDLTVWRAENGTTAGPKCATCPLACTSGTTVTCATPP